MTRRRSVTVVLANTDTRTFLPNLFPFKDSMGLLRTFSTRGKVDLTGPFFQSLGTNGRSCATCHDTFIVGNHSVSAPLNIGVADLTNPLGVSYLPVITLRNETTGKDTSMTDPGRALITGNGPTSARSKDRSHTRAGRPGPIIS